MLRTAMAARRLVRPIMSGCQCLALLSNAGAFTVLCCSLHLRFAVKRAKQVRRCAQVLLDCRWFVKRFIDQRIEMLEDKYEEEHIRVVSTLGTHLKLQVCT